MLALGQFRRQLSPAQLKSVTVGKVRRHQGAQRRHQPRIFRAAPNQLVEFPVGPRSRYPIAPPEGGAQLCRQAVQLFQVDRRYSLPRQFQGQRLQRHAHLLHLLGVLFVERQYRKTAMLQMDDQALLGQHQQRLADRPPADPHLSR